MSVLIPLRKDIEACQELGIEPEALNAETQPIGDYNFVSMQKRLVAMSTAVSFPLTSTSVVTAQVGTGPALVTSVGSATVIKSAIVAVVLTGVAGTGGFVVGQHTVLKEAPMLTQPVQTKSSEPTSVVSQPVVFEQKIVVPSKKIAHKVDMNKKEIATPMSATIESLPDDKDDTSPMVMSSLTAQLQLYDRAQRALAEGKYDAAQRDFAYYLNTYPDGELDPEARVGLLRAIGGNQPWANVEQELARHRDKLPSGRFERLFLELALQANQCAAANKALKQLENTGALPESMQKTFSIKCSTHFRER